MTMVYEMGAQAPNKHVETTIAYTEYAVTPWRAVWRYHAHKPSQSHDHEGKAVDHVVEVQTKGQGDKGEQDGCNRKAYNTECLPGGVPKCTGEGQALEHSERATCNCSGNEQLPGRASPRWFFRRFLEEHASPKRARHGVRAYGSCCSDDRRHEFSCVLRHEIEHDEQCRTQHGCGNNKCNGFARPYSTEGLHPFDE